MAKSRRPGVKREKTGVKERILGRAAELFYRRGFTGTGVREIIKGARTVPASFYDHFPSKDNLGVAYVEEKGRLLTRNLTTLAARTKSVKELLHAWVAFKKDQIARKKFLGCPVAGFAYQAGELPAAHQKSARAITETWAAHLREVFEDAVKAGELNKKADTARMAREVLLVYEGSLAMWKLTRDDDYIDDMERGLLEVYERYRAR